ncbi:hypothetical protein SAMN05444157_0106 [Frankineae bacterium MT45]|nr:hypothetical protein SAMN05444157_0106 [Frankineae bacterium MT45]
MSRTIVASIMILVMLFGVLSGVIVAAHYGNSGPACYPVVEHSDWLLDQEQQC